MEKNRNKGKNSGKNNKRDNNISDTGNNNVNKDIAVNINTDKGSPRNTDDTDVKSAIGINKNDTFILTITDMSDEGLGIGKTEGFTWFVKDTVIGDTAEASAVKLKKNYGFARLLKVIKASPFRIPEKCPVARKCGGCQLMALDYDSQLEFKENKVLNDLERIGGFDSGAFIRLVSGNKGDAPETAEIGEIKTAESEGDNRVCRPANSGSRGRILVEPIIGADPDRLFRYRNKAQFPIGRDKDGKITAGFYAGRTHSIIPCEDCLLGAKENKFILKTVMNWMERFGIEPYDEMTGRGTVRHLLIRKGENTGMIMVCPVINADKLPREQELLEMLLSLNNDPKFAQGESAEGESAYRVSGPGAGGEREPGVRSYIASVSYSVNKKNTNVIMGDKVINIYGTPYIEDVISRREYEDIGACRGDKRESIHFRISPLSFFQVNSRQMEKLYSTALHYAGLTGKETVWDLYCGTGTISLFLAGRAKKVYGVEIIPQAIENAKENARINGIDNAEFFVGKAEEVLPDWYEKNKAEVDSGSARPDVIVVDPPRKGCDERCLETIADMKPERIVYVSCNSSTLARDIKYLCGRGYELKRVRACDMFSWTVHVEVVIQMTFCGDKTKI